MDQESGSVASGGINWREVAGRIREAREAKGFTQPGLADAITPEGASKRTHYQTVLKDEKGGRVPIERIEAIAIATGRSPRWLLFGDVVPLDVDAIIARAKSEAFEEAAGAMHEMKERVLQAAATAPMAIVEGKISLTRVVSDAKSGLRAEQEGASVEPETEGGSKHESGGS